MKKQLSNAEDAVEKYQFSTHKIDKTLTFIFFILFMISLGESITSVYSIVLYGCSLVCILYYIIWFRKRTEYIIFKKDKIMVSRGLSLRMEEISNDSIRKVHELDKKTEIFFLKDGIENKVVLLNILLDDKDRIEIVRHLHSIATLGESADNSDTV
jgi:putative ubiquitin-RnfH superfamily antitoxin RatB of RatAB toxin-antitoxin module